jgi:hypothetical protein
MIIDGNGADFAANASGIGTSGRRLDDLAPDKPSRFKYTSEPQSIARVA